MFCKRLGLKFFPLFTGWWGSEEALITLIKSARLGDWIPDSNQCWWSMHIKAIWHEAILIWLTDLSWLSALQIKVRLVCNCTYIQSWQQNKQGFGQLSKLWYSFYYSNWKINSTQILRSQLQESLRQLHLPSLSDSTKVCTLRFRGF